MESDYQQVFESILFETFGKDVGVLDFSVASAGTVNTGARVVSSEGIYFIKLNEQPVPGFFGPEARDLEEISSWLPTPAVLRHGKVQGYQYLVTDFIEEGLSTPKTYSEAGRQLASLHKVRHNQFGHEYSNFLSSLPMDNTWKTDGIDFLIQNRILPMVGYCLMEEKISLELYKKIELLCSRLGRIIPQEAPSLLHGDLWTGNLITGPHGKGFFIDPACYFGFRESELAFTYLFGGFEASFYEAYLEEFPLEPGFGDRVSVYHIHPLLVHVYLFGSGYIAGLERILKRFL